MFYSNITDRNNHFMLLVIVISQILVLGGCVSVGNQQKRRPLEPLILSHPMDIIWRYEWFYYSATDSVMEHENIDVVFHSPIEEYNQLDLILPAVKSNTFHGIPIILFETLEGLFGTLDIDSPIPQDLNPPLYSLMLPRDYHTGKKWVTHPDGQLEVVKISKEVFSEHEYTVVEVHSPHGLVLEVYKWALGLGLLRCEYRYADGRLHTYQLIDVLKN